MLIFERKNTVGGASALFLFVETGWRTGKRGGSGRGKGIPVGGVSRSGTQIHLPQTLNEEAIADEFSDWEQVS